MAPQFSAGLSFGQPVSAGVNVPRLVPPNAGVNSQLFGLFSDVGDALSRRFQQQAVDARQADEAKAYSRAWSAITRPGQVPMSVPGSGYEQPGGLMTDPGKVLPAGAGRPAGAGPEVGTIPGAGFRAMTAGGANPRQPAVAGRSIYDTMPPTAPSGGAGVMGGGMLGAVPANMAAGIQSLMANPRTAEAGFRMGVGLLSNPPKARERVQDAAGRWRFVDTGEAVFPDVQVPHKMPQSRTVPVGGESVVQEWDGNAGRWVEVGRGPRFAPRDGTVYRDRKRRLPDGTEVFEVSTDGGRTWAAEGDPVPMNTGAGYRQRRRPVSDESEVFEVSTDGGKSWSQLGDPFKRGSAFDPLDALMSAAIGARIAGQGGGQAGGQAAAGGLRSGPGLTEADRSEVSDAAAALAAGADAAAVAERLRTLGIDPAALETGE